MSDLHKALTDLCDKAEYAEYVVGYGVTVGELRALLAEHPPTAPVVDRAALAKVIEDAWQRGDSDVDAIIAYLDGGEGEPRCQHVSPSPWGATQCALPDDHQGRHAYSPSESIPDGGEGS